MISNWFVTQSGIFLLAFLFGHQHVHFVTFTLWMNMRIAQSMEGHSGFAFPKPVSVALGHLFTLVPFLGTESAYHDFHHEKNVGNFSSFFSIWDTLSGTN